MKTLKYTIIITTKSGLHIGSGNSKIEIGGMDQPVIKDMNGYPYIPASSFKGKLRSLYEISQFSNDLGKSGLKEFDGMAFDEVSMFFGKAGNNKTILNQSIEDLGPTRFIFRDFYLSEEKQSEGKYGKKEFERKRKLGEPIFEEKMEVSIERRTGTASKSGPRPIERVPAGTVFVGSLVVRLFENPAILAQYGVKSEEEILEMKFGKNLSKLIALIENDYLGGQGSRGSGEIECKVLSESIDN